MLTSVSTATIYPLPLEARTQTASLRGGESFRSWSGSRGWGHTIADTEDKVDLRDMREAAATLGMIVLRMATMKELSLKRKSNEEVRHLLESYNYDEVMNVL